MTGPYSQAQNEEVANLIREMRTRRGLTQAALCEAAAVSMYTIQKLERGIHVRLATMKAILEAMGRMAKLDLDRVKRVCQIYGLNIEALDQRLIAQGPGAETIDPVAAKDLHLLLDRAIAHTQQMPDVIQAGVLHSMQAMLATWAGETRPAASASSAQLAKRYPPEQVGDWEVEVIEPAEPKAKRKKSG